MVEKKQRQKKLVIALGIIHILELLCGVFRGVVRPNKSRISLFFALLEVASDSSWTCGNEKSWIDVVPFRFGSSCFSMRCEELEGAFLW